MKTLHMKKFLSIMVVSLVVIAAVTAYALLPAAPEGALLAEKPVKDMAAADRVIASELIWDAEVPLSAAPQEEEDYAQQVLELVNKARLEAGVAALELDEALSQAAAVRAAEGVASFSHTRPDGTKYKTAITQLGLEPGYLGENLATGQETAEGVMESWLKSEGHRANILNPNYQKIGVARAENTGNRYRGYTWVQLFTD